MMHIDDDSNHKAVARLKSVYAVLACKHYFSNYTNLVGYGKSVDQFDVVKKEKRWTKDKQRRINKELDICLRIVFGIGSHIHTQAASRIHNNPHNDASDKRQALVLMNFWKRQDFGKDLISKFVHDLMLREAAVEYAWA